MVKVLLHIPDLNEDPHPSEVYHLVQLRLMDVDPHKMERQIDAIDTKYLEIQYYDTPHWYSLTDTEKVHQMHKVRLGRFTNHDSWLEIDGKEWRYPEIVTHIAEVRALLDLNETEHLLEDIDDSDQV
jgi:hypothetical protein